MLLPFSFKLNLKPRTQGLCFDFIQTDVSKRNTSSTELKTRSTLLQISKKIKVVFCKERKIVCVPVIGQRLYFQNSVLEEGQMAIYDFNPNEH